MTTLAEFFDSYYRLRPVNATFTGVHEYDHRLPDWSPGGLASAAADMHAIRASLAAGGAVSLDSAAGRDRELAMAFLDVQLAEDESLHFQRGNPSLAIGELAFGAISLMTRPFAPVDIRAAAATARLADVPRFLDGARGSLAHGVVDEWRTKCLRECAGVERLLGDGIERWIVQESIPESIARDLTRAAVRAGAGVEAFSTWLLHQAESAPRERAAIGPDLYDLLLARGHWCQQTRRALAAEAAAALEEALARLHERAAALAQDGWAEVQQRLGEDRPGADRYLATYREIWDASRRRAEDRDVVTWPEYPIRFVPIPPQTRDAAPFLYYLHYRSPAPFDRLDVHDYVVPQQATTSAIKLNHVVHHAGVGHHVQNYHAYHGPSDIGRVAAVDCACRIGMFLGGTMAEGWACYATDVMEECGFFTPEESVAQQHTRVRLLARAVVDIGLHDRSMTYEQAVSVYRDRVGMAPEAAQAEACKNSMFPGTAVMYWLGTDGLHRLRRARERADGAAFSLKRFHDRLLSFGSIPVPLIARVWS